jgi:hypothetical protein
MLKPILFSGVMVNAIIGGSKTMTRRVVPAATLKKFPDQSQIYVKNVLGQGLIRSPKEFYEEKSRIKTGDILWVRETWKETGLPQHGSPRFLYRADGDANGEFFDKNVPVKWKPSIFMPRDAARLFLLVTGVRAERLYEITEKDAGAEGFSPTSEKFGGCQRGDMPDKNGKFGCPDECNCANARENFFRLWDKLNKKGGYGSSSNPWVYVVKFENRIAAQNNPALLEANFRKGFKTDQVISDPTLITPAQMPEFFERWNRITANPQPTENREKPKKTLKGVLFGIFAAIVIAAVVIKIAIAILGW